MEPSVSEKSAPWIKRPNKKYFWIGSGGVLGSILGSNITVRAFGSLLSAVDEKVK